MKTDVRRCLHGVLMLAGLLITPALAQPDSPATDLKPRPGDPGHTQSKAADGSQAASPASIKPVPEPSMHDLSTRSVIPLPSTGGAGVAPPAMPGAPNPSPPGEGSRP